MKKTTTLILILTFITFFTAKATTVIIQAIGTTSANELFSPSVANANCGDTIRWVLVSGTHTTASTTIPAGAQPWSSPNITANGYIYVVTVAGTYNYTCHPANGGHMEASIVVTCGTGIVPVTLANVSYVFPNPSTGKISIDIKDAPECTFTVYNSTGKKVFEDLLTSPITEAELNFSNGIYFYELKSQENRIGNGKLVIQN